MNTHHHRRLGRAGLVGLATLSLLAGCSSDSSGSSDAVETTASTPADPSVASVSTDPATTTTEAATTTAKATTTTAAPKTTIAPTTTTTVPDAEFLHIALGDPTPNEAASGLAKSAIGLDDDPVVALAKLGALDGTIALDGAALVGSNVVTGKVAVVDQQWLVSGTLSAREMVDAVIASGQFPDGAKRTDDNGSAASGVPAASTKLAYADTDHSVQIKAIGPLAGVATTFVEIIDARLASGDAVPALPAVLTGDLRATEDVNRALENDLRLSGWRYQAGIVGSLASATLPTPEWWITFEVPADADPATLTATLCAVRRTEPTENGFHCVTPVTATAPIWTIAPDDNGVLTATLKGDFSKTE